MKSQNVTDATNNNTIFMVWKFTAAKEAVKQTFEQLGGLLVNLNNSANIRFPQTETSCVMGVGHDAWVLLDLPTPLPKELVNFQPIVGEKHTAVATPGDLHFHIRAQNQSVCYDLAAEIVKLLDPVAECIEEVHGFRYWDGRSILGFVDGTENPQGDDRDFFAKVGDEDALYKGGSYLFVQKYIHPMMDWNALPVEEQEKVIGRYKQSDIEMPDGVKPANAHAALANIGSKRRVIRDNMPFVNNANKEVGTYFIAYANTFSSVELMLQRMFIGEPAGNYDRLLDFSKAVTGTLFFVPTFDMLADYSA